MKIGFAHKLPLWRTRLSPLPWSSSGLGPGAWLRAGISGLKAKLILPYVLLTLAIAMIGTFVVIRLVASSARERFVNLLHEANRVSADGIVRRERVHLENLRLMAFTQGVPEALASEDAGRLQELLWPLALNNHVSVVTALDARGREILTLARDPGSSQYTLSQGGDFSNVSLAVSVLNQTSDSLGDKYAGLLTTAYGPYLFTSAPVRDAAGELVGVLMIGTPLDGLLADLKSQALADIFVLDAAGNVLATTLAPPDEGYGALRAGQVPASSPGGSSPDASSPDASSLDASSLDASSPYELALYGRHFQAVYGPLVVRQQTVGGLGVVLPSSYVVATEATSRNTFAAFFALGTGAIILVGYALAQRIARPILHLRAMSQAVAAGDLGQQSGIQQPDEIGELAAAFDAMTQNLRERTAEAARLYAETAQRNRELAHINQRLQSTQAQLIQSEKLSAIGQLTAGIVHDVKNPLTVIIGLAECLQEDGQLDPKTLQSDLEVIRSSAVRANTIVSDLLKFARQSTPTMLHQDMGQTLESALRLTEYLARKAGVEVVADIPLRAVMATYDAQQIEQVLINLIQNAIQAMPAGGALRVSLSHAKDAVAIGVQDTGTGIPPSILPRIFDPFFTTKPEGEGTGLGLSVSYGIVARHNGRLDVESRLGQGTTFTLLLPASPPAQSRAWSR